MTVCKKPFGKTRKGEEAFLYTLANASGMEIAVSDYGATLVSVVVSDREGKMRDVVLGYDDVSGYEKGTVFFGATVGRCANRIGQASFELNGVTYSLEQNDNGNNLHSGMDFYNKRFWEVEHVEEQTITCLLHSPDGDQGFPGALDMRVTYTLTDDNAVEIHYHAVPDKDTIINMTNHSYFNLNGHNSGTVLNQQVRICANAFTKADAQSIPTGELVDVTGTPMDFRVKKEIGKEIEADYEALLFGRGYDHNWVLNREEGVNEVAEMFSPESGIGLRVKTDLPGMQLYTANFVENEHGKEGAVYQMRHAACFETQYFPDAIHKEQFEGPICCSGQPYETRTIYQFYVE